VARTPARPLAAAVLAIALLGVPVAGCDRNQGPVVDLDGGSVTETDTLTPLERGKVRREVLDAARAWQETWLASDLEAMSRYADDEVLESFREPWEAYAAKGHRVEHKHEVIYLDVVDMNASGSQALVTYRYDDTSYVVDSAGRTVETLPPFDDKEMQLTLDLQDDGTWMIVRIVAGQDAYR
jgi:hypothetical protein